MGWLASGGTPFAYRMSLPVANALAANDRQIIIPFPGPFLRAKNKVLQSTYADVHVTVADGVTELPCALANSGTQLVIDHAAMPQGRTTLFVYYGHATVAPPPLPWFLQGESGGSVIDNGFDWGTQDTALSDAIWPNTANAPSAKIHDHTYPAQNNAWSMEAKITAQAGAIYSGIQESVSSVSGAGAELRFWIRFKETTTYKTVGGGTPQVFHIRFTNNASVEIYTERSATGYTQNNYTNVGSYAAGEWWQYRLVFDFSSGTYQLSRRKLVTDAWTGLKASGAPTYDIPMRATGALTAMAGTQWLGYQGAVWWMDAVRYRSGAIADTQTIWTVQAIRPNLEVASEEAAGGRVYVFGDELEATYLDSAAATTYYGAATAHKAGIAAGGAKYHYLLKPFEAALLKGTLSAATLHLYLESNADVGEQTTLRAHRFKTTARTGGSLATDWMYYVRPGWSLQGSKSRPTWNTRFFSFWSNYPTGADIAWQTAGATGDAEIDAAEYASLVLDPGFTPGYAALTLPTGWVDGWTGDNYALGVLLKDSTDSAGANNRHVPITAPGQVNGPVLELVYAALDANPLTKRKLTTDTYAYSTFSVQNRYALLPSEHWMGIVGWINNELRLNVAYVTPDGRFALVQKDSAPAAPPLNGNSPGFGLGYDAADDRLWCAGNDTNGNLCVAFCAPGVGGGPGSWIWKTNANVKAAKGTFVVKSSVAHIVCYDSSAHALVYVKYTRATDTWSAAVTLATTTVGGTQRGLAAGHAIGSDDAMTGSGEIWADGSIADYPAWGGLKIDSEYFWYAAKDVGNAKFTGVTRAVFGSTAAAHSVATTLVIDRGELTYAAMSYDSVKNCLHLTYQINSTSPLFAYLYPGYLRHVLTDADNAWKDEAGAAVTLPIDQRMERMAGPVGVCAYCNGNHVNTDGDLLILNLRYTGVGTAGVAYSTPYVSRLPNAGSAFSHVDTGLAMVECALLDIGDGRIKLTGIDSDEKTTMVATDSDDNGATWSGAVVTLSTHTLPAYLLWCSACARTRYLNGRGLMYAQHFAEHGAIWVNALAAEPPGSPIARRMLLDVMADGTASRAFALRFEASATGGRPFRLPFAVEALAPIGRGFPLVFDFAQGLDRRMRLPFESDGDIVLVRRVPMRIETGAALCRTAGLPVESSAGVLSRAFAFPLEFGGGVGRLLLLPVEWDGSRILRRKLAAPLETKQRLSRTASLPTEAAGQTDSLSDRWRVYRTLSEIFLDEWTVIPVSQAIEFCDAWNVRSAMGLELIDTWRVLPPQIVTLWSGDIQLPSGTMEKG